MDLDLSDDQELFRTTAAKFIDARCPVPRVRELIDAKADFDRAVMEAAAELGWFALFVPEEFGGGSVSGSPLADAVIVAEERGREVQPGPFITTNVVAEAIARHGTAEQRAEHLAALGSGASVATWAISDSSGTPIPGSVTATVRNDQLVLDGCAGFVPDARAADLFLVSAADGDGVTQLLVPASAPGVAVVELESLDLTRQFGEVRFDNARVARSAVLGTPGHEAPNVAHQLDVAAVLLVAESVGAMRRLIEFTVDYAKARIAFGRPIGSFQAIKHVLADAAFQVELSTAVAADAARVVAEERDRASEVASIAKATVGDAGLAVAQVCMQIHGGISFTWEHDLHLYMRRLTSDRVLFGDPDWHRERICAIHDL